MLCACVQKVSSYFENMRSVNMISALAQDSKMILLRLGLVEHGGAGVFDIVVMSDLLS